MPPLTRDRPCPFQACRPPIPSPPTISEACLSASRVSSMVRAERLSRSMRNNIAFALSRAYPMEALDHYRVENHGCQESGQLTRLSCPAMLAPIRRYGRHAYGLKSRGDRQSKGRKEMSMAQAKIRVGIVGANVHYGWGSRAHLPALTHLPDYELVAVCTAHQETAEETAKQFGVPLAFHDHQEMLRHPDIDAVAVVVRVPLHYRLTMDALRAG